MTVLERQRRRRARLREAGLSTDGKPLTGRRMVSWARGLHAVEADVERRRCRNCLRKIRPQSMRWRRPDLAPIWRHA